MVNSAGLYEKLSIETRDSGESTGDFVSAARCSQPITVIAVSMSNIRIFMASPVVVVIFKCAPGNQQRPKQHLEQRPDKIEQLVPNIAHASADVRRALRIPQKIAA